MPSLFDITALHTRVNAKGGNAGVVFTVHSNAGAALRVQLMPRGHGSTQTPWLAVGGDVETTLQPGETRQVTVNVNLPDATPPGDYAFSLLVCAVNDPEELFTAGPVVAVSHAAEIPPPKPFPWLPWAIAAACLIIVAAIVFAVTRSKEPEVIAPAPAPAVSESAMVDIIITAVSQERKIQVIKTLRDVGLGLGLKELKDLVENPPQTIRTGVARAEAEEIKRRLEEAGAAVEIR